MKKAALTLLMLATFSYLYCANIKDMPKIIELAGKTFGDYKVISYHSQDKFHNAIWVCQCTKCGLSKNLKGSRLAKGRNTTCYCGVHYNYKHGSKKNKEYRAWRHMLNRCYMPSVREYKRYGGRGIRVCDQWRESYINFIADIGVAPGPDYSLDRIDVNGNYEPGNVRWATIRQQANNTRRTYMVEYRGEKIPLGTFCHEHGLPIELMRGRLNMGWSIEKAMTEPKLIR
jgi:hypothetical protein